MRFKFRLEKALGFLKLRETMMKMEVASVLRKLTRAREDWERLQAATRQLLEETPQRLSEGSAWIPYQTSQVALNVESMRKKEKEIALIQVELAEKQEELGRLAMKRKALENLKDNKYHEHRIEERRREQKKMDELFTLSKLN